MITLVDNGVIAKYIGLSTDDKPQEISANIGMKNGSRFLEIDTGDKYYYDADSSQWMKQPSESGSEGGGGDGDITYASVDVVIDGVLAYGQWPIIPVLYDEGEGKYGCFQSYQVYTNETGLRVPLFKGHAIAPILQKGTAVVSVTGDITFDGYAQFDITGDGTITVKVD